MFKKTRLFFLIALALIVLIVASVLGLHRKYRADFNEQFTELNLAIIEDVQTVDSVGFQQTSWDTQTIIFSQADENSAISKRIAFPLENQSSSITWLTSHWSVYYPKKKASDLKNITAYGLMRRDYQADFLSVKEVSEKELETFYAKEDGSLMTLNDLIADKEQFRKTIQEIWQKPKEAQALEVYSATMKALEVDDWASIAFTYENEALNLNKASISMSVFVESINPAYFSAETLKEFHSLEESRKHLLDSEDTIKIIYELPK